MIRKTPLIPDTFYHLYNRTNHSFEQMFPSSHDYLSFLKRYRAYTTDKLITYGYCLMPNHFHFLIKPTPEFEHSPHCLKNLFISYSKWFNHKYSRRGTLFQNQFKAKLINSDSYLLTVLHYIHQNPLRAKLVTELEDWPFSSYFEYANLRNGSLPDTCLKESYYQDTNQFIENSKNLIQDIDQNIWV